MADRLCLIVSDPTHDRYGQHLSSDEVNELVKPAADSLELVHTWLLDHGIEAYELEYSEAKDWIKVSLPIRDVERLLNTKYSVFRHEDGSHLVRTLEWSLPKHLHNHVTAVQPTNSFFRAAPKSSNVKPVAFDEGKNFRFNKYNPSVPNNMTVAQACNVSAVTPLCLRTLYGTLDYVPQVPGQNKVGLTNYLGEANNRSDVSIFLQRFRPEAASAAYTFKTIVIAGGDDQQTPDNATQLGTGKDLEGNLDAETIIGIDYPTPLTTYNTGGSPPFIPDLFAPTNTNEPYLTWVQYVLSQPDSTIPQVISTSYGDDEQTVPPSYARTVCAQFAQLGARGISLLFASGDEGVGATGDCLTNDGKNTSTFLPLFPSTCPYITSVGGTKNFGPEVAAFDPRNGFASGGGFSNYFPRPSYQDDAVNGYLKILGSQFAGLYNKSGRAYPDISAQSQSFITIWNGTIARLDGTSASTPTVSAVLALVNDALLAAGKPVLGFLNPWLYKKGYKALTDVVSGSAIGCGGAGFPAAKGWDPVTGFGTPVSRGTIS
jgi:tripeptidyl-peptidase I